jgi:PIN domain nuclease of toxin-antitoxin system
MKINIKSVKSSLDFDHYQLGKLPLPSSPFEFVKTQRDLHNIKNLNLNESALKYLVNLPEHHRDPFDRMLVCQALDMDLAILTPDPSIHLYAVTTIW